MDTGLLILLIATAGYLLIADLSNTRYGTSHRLGYHLLFVSFAVGVLLLPIALALHEWLSREFSSLPQFSSLGRFVQDAASIGDKDHTKLLSIALISFALAWLIPKAYERLVDDKDGSVRDRHIREAAEARGDIMKVILAGCHGRTEKGERLGVELLLENDVVCVGFVVESSITVVEENADIELMLTHRGYRDRNTGKFVITETYAGNEPEDYPVITIPISRIVSARKIRLA